MTGAPIDDDPLARAVSRMRRVSEPESPFAGWLARVDDAVVLLVDTRALRGWAGWTERGEHVLSVQDVARTSDGHEALLPWCVERVETFISRRSASGADLSAGEAITLAVSLLRGCVASQGVELTGEWWLTQNGTPAFVCGLGGGDAIGQAAGSVLERLAESRAVTASWRLERLATILREGRYAGDLEEDLFATATPEPLVLTPLTPRRASEARRAMPRETVTPDERESLLGRLLRGHVDAGVGEMVSDAWSVTRRTTERFRRRAARPWLVATAIAGVVVVGGLAWPTADTPPANADPVSSASSSPAPAPVGETVQPAPAPEPEPEPDGSIDARETDAHDDPVRALEAALDRLAGCADSACASELFEDPSTTEMPDGAVDLPAGDRDVQLLDDLGGVAILSVAGRTGESASQLVVMVRTGEGWVIRDVRDVEAP